MDVYLSNLKAGPLPDEDWSRQGRFLLNLDDPIADAFMRRYLTSTVARVKALAASNVRRRASLAARASGKRRQAGACSGTTSTATDSPPRWTSTT